MMKDFRDSMENFRVARFGDKVVIIGYEHDRSEHHYFYPEMDKYIGKTATVKFVADWGDYINLDIDGERFVWHPAWLRKA